MSTPSLQESPICVTDETPATLPCNIVPCEHNMNVHVAQCYLKLFSVHRAHPSTSFLSRRRAQCLQPAEGMKLLYSAVSNDSELRLIAISMRFAASLGQYITAHLTAIGNDSLNADFNYSHTAQSRPLLQQQQQLFDSSHAVQCTPPATPECNIHTWTPCLPRYLVVYISSSPQCGQTLLHTLCAVLKEKLHTERYADELMNTFNTTRLQEIVVWLPHENQSRRILDGFEINKEQLLQAGTKVSSLLQILEYIPNRHRNTLGSFLNRTGGSTRSNFFLHTLHEFPNVDESITEDLHDHKSSALECEPPVSDPLISSITPPLAQSLAQVFRSTLQFPPCSFCSEPGVADMPENKILEVMSERPIDSSPQHFCSYMDGPPGMPVAFSKLSSAHWMQHRSSMEPSELVEAISEIHAHMYAIVVRKQPGKCNLHVEDAAKVSELIFTRRWPPMEKMWKEYRKLESYLRRQSDNTRYRVVSAFHNPSRVFGHRQDALMVLLDLYSAKMLVKEIREAITPEMRLLRELQEKSIELKQRVYQARVYNAYTRSIAHFVKIYDDAENENQKVVTFPLIETVMNLPLAEQAAVKQKLVSYIQEARTALSNNMGLPKQYDLSSICRECGRLCHKDLSTGASSKEKGVQKRRTIHGSQMGYTPPARTIRIPTDRKSLPAPTSSRGGDAGRPNPSSAPELSNISKLPGFAPATTTTTTSTTLSMGSQKLTSLEGSFVSIHRSNLNDDRKMSLGKFRCSHSFCTDCERIMLICAICGAEEGREGNDEKDSKGPVAKPSGSTKKQ